MYEISNNVLSIKVSNQGGSIEEVILKDYYTYDSLNLKLVENLDFNFSFFLKKQKINTNELVFNNVYQNGSKISLEFQDKNQNGQIFQIHQRTKS